jgi:hypothetical protein
MSKIEGFMTKSEYADFIEKRWNEKLDDLLVNAGVVPKRIECFVWGRGTGMLVRLKEEPRVNFKIEV